MRTLFPTFILLTTCWLQAQNTPPVVGANTDPTYQQLRHITLGSEAVSVNGLTIEREGGRFDFRSGTFYFLAPVNGKVTGAVFVGDGVFTLSPPTPLERAVLGELTQGHEYAENFAHLALRFTDATYEEIKKGATPASGAGEAASVLDSSRDALRNPIQLGSNLDGRILQDVLSTQTGGLFVAFIAGKNYSAKTVFWIDPHGLNNLGIAPEEVALMTYDENKAGVWAAYHRLSEYAANSVSSDEKNALVFADHQTIDTTIDHSGHLTGDASSTLISGVDGLRVVPLNLYRTLRVESVSDDAGAPLPFIQEDKNQDPDFYIVLPKAIAKNEHFTVRVRYSGKDAVRNEGGGNYFPVARESWYPSTGFGDYATYDLTFRVPKGLTMIATGELVSDKEENGNDVTVWHSGVPLSVAGFNFGRFKRMKAESKQGYEVDAYANSDQPDFIKRIQRANENDEGPVYNHMQEAAEKATNDTNMALGGMETTALMKKPFAEAQLAMALYSDYFGANSYKHVAITQQPDCNFGQSWPTLVYLPLCAMLDSTVRHQLGLDTSTLGVDLNNTYWNAVAAHETAHQWWGHTVGFRSYHDQWMSEGFADFSTSLFLQVVYTDKTGANSAFNRFWDDQLRLLTLKSPEGHRSIDVGPVTLGLRLSNQRTDRNSGFVYFSLVYPKGAYILHMLRMMMWNQRGGDQSFKAMMHDFVDTYRNRTASTEDFKAIAEKHMLPGMDLDGNHRLDWFFNEYVYGRELPSYHFEYSFGKQADGTANLHVKLVQANVDPHFKMLVPLYLELADGRVVRLGQIAVFGDSTIDQVVPLGLKDTPRAAMIDYFHDVLATVDQK